MQNTFQRFAIPPFTKAQQFLVNLLSEYYEQKSEKNSKLISKLDNQNRTLLDEIKSLKSQVSALQHEKVNLYSKLKATNNMIRIITKSKENANICKTPIKINVPDVDRLLNKKLNETTLMPLDKNNNVPVKLLPINKVVQEKEVKKIVLPKAKENVFYPRSAIKKVILKPKAVLSSALKKQRQILPNSTSSRKSLFKGKENEAADSGTHKIISKSNERETTKQRTILVDDSTKTKLIKYVKSKNNGGLIAQKNLNETFVVKC